VHPASCQAFSSNVGSFTKMQIDRKRDAVTNLRDLHLWQ
jgi:hypothetical protein